MASVSVGTWVKLDTTEAGLENLLAHGTQALAELRAKRERGDEDADE